ncbi:hypothetical protein [Spirosoma gilvum]
MKRLLIVISLLASSFACSPRVAVDSSSRADFNKYKTFAWMDSE